ncbi:hypothetical protein QF037_009526 [Streptomyces canus]|nr:hypothetical protein [Streptomyces canus]
MRSHASSTASPGAHRLPLPSTKCGAQSSPADDGAAEGDERVVDVVADLPADAQAAEPVQQRDRSFHDPAVHAQAGAVPGAAPGEVRGDLEPADLVPVDLVVIAAVGVQVLGAAQWPAALAADRRDGPISGISWVTSLRLPPVVIAASGMPCASTIRWCLLPALPRSTGDGPVAGPPFIARMWLESTAAREKSSRSAARSSESSSSCRRCQTPASFQSRSRRQQVIPEPKPSSWGRNSQRISVYSTNRIPHSTLRLSRRLRPGRRGLRGTTGSSGSMRAHNSSSISHGLAAVFLVSTGSHPLRPASTRTDTMSFPEVQKPLFVRSR